MDDRLCRERFYSTLFISNLVVTTLSVGRIALVLSRLLFLRVYKTEVLPASSIPIIHEIGNSFSIFKVLKELFKDKNK